MFENLVGIVVAAITSLGGANAPVDHREAMCLTKNIYYEARGTTVEEQKKIADVTITYARANSRSICEEVYHPFRYSWTLKEKSLPNNPVELRAWKRAAYIASAKLSGKSPVDSTIDHFHDKTIAKPRWAYSMRMAYNTPSFFFYSSIKK